jgi:hypothetical protein
MSRIGRYIAKKLIDNMIRVQREEAGEAGGDVLIGNGEVITDKRSLSPFDKIKVSGSCEARFHSSEEYSAVVTVDSNINEYIETVVKNGVLRIKLKPGRRYYYDNKTVDVYCPALAGVSISGSGSFEAADKIKSQEFEIEITGSGSIKCAADDGDEGGALECDNFTARITGSGSIDIDGSGKDAEIRISGSGHFNGKAFKLKNCSVHISGSGAADVCAEDILDANISGSGKIRCKGNPKIDFKSSGSGRLIKYGEKETGDR